MEVALEGIYEHFKGKKYKLLKIAFDTETLKKVAILEALYGDYIIWARPFEMFAGEVTRDGKTFSRYKLLQKPKDNL